MILNYSINFKNLSTSQKDVFSSLMTQLWRIISGPLSLLLIPLFLSPEDQGFWYTFMSLSALSIFADLGFTTIILQFSAHEYAFLKFENGKLAGDELHLARISSLFKFVLRWTSIMILIVFPIITVIGIVMFTDKSESYYWLIPWLIYLIASAGNFVCYVISSFFQGCEQVAKIQRITLISSITTTLTLIPLLFYHKGLYSLALSLLTGVIVFIFLLYKNYHEPALQLLHHKEAKGNWRTELLPLLGKYAISWSSGYFAFQVYTPFMFHYKGAVEAGKVGITLSLVSAIYTISNVWFLAKIPKFNILVAERKWINLDKLFFKTLILSSSTYLLGVCVLFGVFLIFNGNWDLIDRISSRFMGIIPLLMLIVGWFLQIFVSGSAAYLRAHKKEVYMYVSLLGALYIVLTTFLSVRYLPGEYLFLGFVTSYLIFGIVEYKIFKKNRAVWHKN
jgi:O-antigen/teichoic acid export membrane protein